MTATRQAILSMETLTARLEEIKARHGAPPWSEPLFMSDDMQAFVICQAPGHQNDTHYHEHDEWWVIMEGELSWQYEFDPTPHVVRAGDFVWGPKGQWHHIEVLGDQPSIRIGINVRGEYHRYDRPGCHPAPKQ
jgi:quercetin dioxygenase-like cupin family protein